MTASAAADVSRVLAISGDLSRAWAALAILLAVASLVLLALELRRRRKGAALVVATGALGTVALLLAVLRPATIVSRGSKVGPRVVVLADRSSSMELASGAGQGTRKDVEAAALASLRAAAKDARFDVLGFGEGAPRAWDPAKGDATDGASDLGGALAGVASAAAERPAAIVVMSDGRLDRPAGDHVDDAVRASLGALGVPVHTVGVATRAPRDASVRYVRAAGAAVAHQPLPLRIEVGCDGGLACDDLPVTVRELLEGGSPVELARGVAHLENGVARVELTVTLERAGASIVEVAVQAPAGDEIPANDRRLVTFDVARERVRILHVAGRPTYDTRALRMWLKADASVDLVTFFILRTPRSAPRAGESELALIPFPVDELFSVHLPSFDAVILQDFDGRPPPAGYGLQRHLPALAAYVKRGGGIVMVGGPAAFGGGGYVESPLAEVLPVGLPPDVESRVADTSGFVPVETDLARGAPMLRASRALLGGAIPEMPGSNLVGDARPGSFVLWEHPRLRTPKGAPMPVLTLGESGNGRAIALTVDGTYRFAYSALASESAGRAHAALWDGLIGWLMRDPRFEPAQVEVARCIAGRRARISVRPLPGATGSVSADVVQLGAPGDVQHATGTIPSGGGPLALEVGPLPEGAFSARVRVGDGPSTRRDFACERGGDEWADSRPDDARLRAIAAATGGRFVTAADVASLPLPQATEVATERRVAPLLPPWAWSLAAAVCLGAHWILRRRSGLS